MTIQVGKALGTLSPVLEKFDSVNGVTKPSGAHTAPGFTRDRDLIVDHLHKCYIFTSHQGRKHASFPLPRDVLHTLDHNKIVQWMVDHM